jgi:hypothetical protein
MGKKIKKDLVFFQYLSIFKIWKHSVIPMGGKMTAPAETLSFEKVWLMFQESSREFKEYKERMEEADRKYREEKEEADRKSQEETRELKASMKETDRLMQENARRMKETDRKMGELSNRFGELAEHLVAPGVKEKFNALGFTFDKCSKNVSIADAQDEYSGAEIDILLENGDVAIAVEVKSRALEKDVTRHLQRMEVLRRWADRHNDKRVFLGAMASAIMPNEMRKYIQKAGLYAIEQTGDTVAINVPDNFVPRKW